MLPFGGYAKWCPTPRWAAGTVALRVGLQTHRAQQVAQRRVGRSMPRVKGMALRAAAVMPDRRVTPCTPTAAAGNVGGLDRQGKRKSASCHRAAFQTVGPPLWPGARPNAVQPDPSDARPRWPSHPAATRRNFLQMPTPDYVDIHQVVVAVNVLLSGTHFASMSSGNGASRNQREKLNPASFGLQS